MTCSRAHVALLTGAAGGIGRATALALAQERFNLALVGRSTATLNQFAEEIKQTAARPGAPECDPSALLVITADQTRPEDCQRIIDQTIGHFGRIDVLINNAAICEVAPLLQSSGPLIERTFAANFLGPLRLIQLTIPQMRRKQGGHEGPAGRIINISSMAAVDPFPGLAMYAASKCALDSLTRSIMNECGPTAVESSNHQDDRAGGGLGIESYSIAPGAVETRMLRSVVSTADLPTDLALDPADVAKIILDCALGRRSGDAGTIIQVPSP